MTLIRLPIAPSVNNLFANGENGRYRTVAYNKWRTAAGWQLNLAHVQPFGKMRVQIGICVNDAMKGDIDNRCKGPIDLLVAHHIIEDDKQVWRVSIERVAASICKAREMLLSIEPYKETGR